MINEKYIDHDYVLALKAEIRRLEDIIKEYEKQIERLTDEKKDKTAIEG